MLIVAQPRGVDNIEIFYFVIGKTCADAQKDAPGVGAEARRAGRRERLFHAERAGLGVDHAPAGHFASMEKRPSFIVQRTETMPMGVGTSPAA